MSRSLVADVVTWPDWRAHAFRAHPLMSDECVVCHDGEEHHGTRYNAEGFRSVFA